MKKELKMLLLLLIASVQSIAQTPVDISGYNNKNGTKVIIENNAISVSWPISEKENGNILIDLETVSYTHLTLPTKRIV